MIRLTKFQRFGFGAACCLLISASLIEGVKKRECIVDDSEPEDDPNNVYKCDLEAKCCHEEGKPSCCKPRPAAEARMDQIKLWGTLAGFVFVLAMVMFCCRHDGDCCCNRKDGGRYKYCCCGPLIYREGKEPAPKMDGIDEIKELEKKKKKEEEREESEEDTDESDDEESDDDDDEDSDEDSDAEAGKKEARSPPPPYKR